jgi:hypothetical protein
MYDQQHPEDRLSLQHGKEYQDTHIAKALQQNAAITCILSL